MTSIYLKSAAKLHIKHKQFNLAKHHKVQGKNNTCLMETKTSHKNYDKRKKYIISTAKKHCKTFFPNKTRNIYALIK